MQEVYIAAACRTAIGKFLGSLKDTHVKELGRVVGEEALRRAGIPANEVDEVICGNVIQAGNGANIARQIQGAIGIPWKAPACTINQLCTSSMRALEIGYHKIILGISNICLVLGVENMSMSPYLLHDCRSGYRMGCSYLEDSMLRDALLCSLAGYHMGMTAENIAQKFSITRKEQDQLAAFSHKKAVSALREGKFKKEIVPIKIFQNKQTVIFDTDEHPREDTTEETLSKLPPVFKERGTVTAGNSSGINDGAAAILLISASKAKTFGIKPLAKIEAISNIGIEPKFMGLGPALAIPEVLKKANLQFSQIECWEINEAFAAQYLGVEKLLKEKYGFILNRDKVNKNGSGISLGHPLGCTGLRILVTLIYEMERMDAHLGCASLCAGGGPAMAVIVSR